MKIRVYIDEDAMSHALVEGLRARDVDVTTTLCLPDNLSPDDRHFHS